MESENALGLVDYVAVMRRRRTLLTGVFLGVVLGGATLALALPDMYRSTARFRLVNAAVEDATTGGNELFDQYVSSLSDKVLTSKYLGEILGETNPYPELSGNEAEALDKLASDISVEMITQTVLLPGGGREADVIAGFSVAFEHRSPETAAQVAQRVASSFVQVGREEQLAVANSRKEFFSAEAERFSKEIAKLEQEMADFKSQNFGQLPEAVQANMALRGRTEQELEGVEREIRTLQQQRVFVDQQLRQAQAAPVAGNLQALEAEYARKAALYAETHPDLIALRRQIDLLRRGGGVVEGNTLQSQLNASRTALAEARQRYSDDHPDVKRMLRDIEALEARIAAGESASANLSSETVMTMQLQTQLHSIDTQIGGLQARSAQLRGRLAQVDAQLGSTPEVERGYQAITRGLDGARNQYRQMIDKRLDAEVEVAAINSGSADRFALVSAPGVPREPAGPKRLAILVMSLLAGVVLAFTVVLTAEMFDSGVRGTRDVREALGMAPLAVVPQIQNSVYRRQRLRRVAILAGSVVLGAPALYALIHLLSA